MTTMRRCGSAALPGTAIRSAQCETVFRVRARAGCVAQRRNPLANAMHVIIFCLMQTTVAAF